MSIGERIKRLRIDRGLTQEELGRRVGLQKAAIYKYENGIVTNLKRSVIAELARVLDTTPAYIMGWESHGNQLGEKIAKYREGWSVTQEGLASYLDIPVEKVVKWESGQIVPNVFEMHDLARALSVSVDDLMSVDAQMQIKMHEEDFLSDQIFSMGMTCHMVTDGAGNCTFLIANDSMFYEFTLDEFENMKVSIREYVAFKINEALKKCSKITDGRKDD